MANYLFQISYSAEAWAALIKHPQDRGGGGEQGGREARGQGRVFLLDKELFPTELIEELNRLKPLFNNANLPNTYKLLEEVCEQLYNINQIFETDDYEDFPSRPSSRSSSHSSRPSSPSGENSEKIQQLQEAVKFYSKKADGYLQNLQRLEAENDNKDLKIEELKSTIRQLKKLSETEQEKAERERLERERKTTGGRKEKG